MHKHAITQRQIGDRAPKPDAERRPAPIHWDSSRVRYIQLFTLVLTCVPFSTSCTG
jgi:hypothetical protein